MRNISLVIVICMLITPTQSFGDVTWGQVLDTEAEHQAYFASPITHFNTPVWTTSGSWSPTEGFMRWTLGSATGEDDTGYYITHPQTTGGPVYLSFVGRWGSTWPNKHTGGGWKYMMFYNTTDSNPRPTVFWEFANGTSSYAILGPDIAAGGNGIDEFGESDPWVNYPNHTYKEVPSVAATQWYFYVFGLVGNYIYMWIYSQDGTLTGGAQGNSYFAVSQEGSFGSYTWYLTRLLAYLESTAEGDANSYVDISHISVTQTKPNLPDGFLTSTPTRKLNNVTGVRVTLH